jgi:deoxyadenosine/deoxycytidine kinase
VSYEPARYIAIEGPIRVGKSTLAQAIALHLHGRVILDKEDNPFLRDFYEEKAGSSFRTQMHFLYSRYDQLREIDPAVARAPVVADYMFEKDRIFAYINLNDEELHLYDAYYNLLSAQLAAPDLVIYLQAPPHILRERIQRKARELGSEMETSISQEYLEEVVRAYEHFFFHYKASRLLVVDTSEIDFVARRQDLEELLHRVTQPVKGTQYFLPLGSQGE